MPGHLFIVQGDLTRIACDAWLLPTGRSLQIRNDWLRDAPASFKELVSQARSSEGRYGAAGTTWECDGILNVPDGWRSREIRSFAVKEWQTDDHGHQAWATNIVVDSRRPIDEQARWVAGGAKQFVERAVSALSDELPAHRRQRHLLAVPVVGTGAGGGWAVAGAILRELIRVLRACVATLDVDVALVTHTRDQLAAAQHARRRIIESESASTEWEALPEELKALGRSLAARSARGELVLFLGAGVSAGAGLPAWQGLLDGLALEAGVDETTRSALKNLPVVDQARYLRDRMERPGPGVAPRLLSEAIAKKVTADRYSLMHGLLANLDVAESVTTNYDTLFEDASEAAGYKTAVLPYTSAEGATRWLLKMHGCVLHPNDIVLTREDFLRYGVTRGALASIVQALLITRHMLFVGFSLADENFHRIADEVRKVIRLPSSDASATAPKPFGTALLIDPSPLMAHLWTGDIACVPLTDEAMTIATSDTDSDAVRNADAKRRADGVSRLEILLDYVLYEANRNVSHLLDERYTALLSTGEQELKDLLLSVRDNASDDVRALPAWGPVAELLRSLGAGDPGHS